MAKMLEVLSKQDSLKSGLDEIKEMIKRTLEAETRVEMDDNRKLIFKFFSKVNPSSDFHASLRLRQAMTGLWLVDGDKFLAWKSTPNAKLWLSGIPGAGKTILCSTAIDNVLQDSSMSIAVAYFFCDYKKQETQRAETIFGSLATQIALQNSTAMACLEEYYEKIHPQNELERPVKLDELVSVVQQMATNFEKAYIIVDALDECGREAAGIANVLKWFAEGAHPVHLALFSREEEDIREVLADDFSRIEIAAQTEDLELYVGAEMSQRKGLKELQVRNPQLDRDIRSTLINGAQGM